MRLVALLASCIALAASAQAPHDPAALLAAQKEALKVLAFMDGSWRGTAWTLLPGGARRTLVQTERIGPFLDGAVKVIEGRGYRDDGSVGFNALGIISYDPERKAYAMRSWAHGRTGEFALTVLPDGFAWETPAGPGAVVRYTATVMGDAYREVGERIAPGQAPVRVFEMDLRRLGDTDWPAANPVPAR
jgi:hypothetical protein